MDKDLEKADLDLEKKDDEIDKCLKLEDVERLMLENCRLKVKIMNDMINNINLKQNNTLSSIQDRLGVELDLYDIDIEDGLLIPKKR